MKTTPKDFFQHMGAIIALYISTVSILNLLFTVINVAFPNKEIGDYYVSSASISWPVAALIVMFPLFLLFSWLLERDAVAMPEKRTLALRRWLTYITLFIAGLTIAIDLVVLLYYFLDGQTLTAAFILKVLATALVTGGIFWYFITDLRGKLTNSIRKISTIVSIIAIVAAIAVGFMVIGSPRTQRLMRIDDQKVYNLQEIQAQVMNYWQAKQTVPDTLAELTDSFSGYKVSADPQTGAHYEYKKISTTSFELCATFNTKSRNDAGSFARPAYYGMEETWQHEAGRTCYTRTIDPTLYPPRKLPM